MKHYEWTVTGSDALPHTVTLDTDFRANQFDIAVDGIPFPVKASRRHYVMGFAKYTIPVAGKTCHLMARGTQADLAVDGKFIDCGLPYVPFPPIPKFLSFYLILCALTCLTGGFLTLLVALTTAVRCGRAATNPFLDKRAKLVSCATNAVAAWAIALLLVLLRTLLG